MSKVIVEVCCGSAQDVIEAKKAGADRVELNSDLFHGGLTPSVGELIVAKRETGLPIMAMVRPREGGFCYTPCEYQTALADARALLDAGADGIVFGFLKPDGTVDTDRCREMRALIGGKTAVFHRAIDVTPDWKAAVDTLCELKIDRILTSGQAPSVWEGAPVVAEMVRYARGRIQILPGAGVTRQNAAALVAQTGCTQVHAAIYKLCFDRSALGNPSIFFGGAIYPPEDRYNLIDNAAIGDIRAAVNR